jgi:hypothetical protein
MITRLLITRLRSIFADPDRGSAPVEMAITGLIAIALIGVLIVAGRVAIASSSISGVAGNAARDASLARTPAVAIQRATSTAITDLQAQHLHCKGRPDVAVDTRGFSAPPGTDAVVTVDVTCVVALSDIGMPLMPGSRTLHDHAVSPLDPFRSTALGFTSPDTASARTPAIGGVR